MDPTGIFVDVLLGEFARPILQRLLMDPAARALASMRRQSFVSVPELMRIIGRTRIITADSELLADILHLRHQFFHKATGMTDAEVIRRWEAAPTSFNCLMYKPPTGPEQLIGYFVLLLVTDQAVAAIRTRHIEKGAHIRESDIVQDCADAAGLYVSVVCGKTFRLYPVVSWALRLRLAEIVAHGPGVRWAFARPTTGDGAAAFTSLTDRPVRQMGEIEAFDLRDPSWSRSLLTHPLSAQILPQREATSATASPEDSALWPPSNER